MEQLPDALFIVRQIDRMSHASSLKVAPNAARGRSISTMLILYYQKTVFPSKGQMPLSQPVLSQMELYSSHSRLSISVRRL